jgi:peptide/nickel transport system substrate-binding protein
MTGITTTTVPVARRLPAPGRYMCGLTYARGLLWHSDQDAEKIFAMERATGEVLRVFSCPQARADLAYHDERLCQVGGRPKRLLLIDPDTGEETGQQQVPPASGRLCGVEMSPDGMWMSLRNPTVIQLRDFATMSVLREHHVPGGPAGLTCVNGTVLFADFETGLLRAADGRTGELLATVRVEGHPTGLTWDGYQVWYCDFEARTVKSIRLDDVLNGTYEAGPVPG